MAERTVIKSVKGEQGAGAAKFRLLDAANLFGQSSYTDVGIAQILKEARVQPPTLYHHFGDKEGLFVAWAIGAIERLGASLAVPREPTSAEARLEWIAKTLADSAHPDLLQLLRDTHRLGRPESRESVMEAVHRSVFEPLYEIFLGAMEKGVIRRDPVRKVTAAFVSYAHALRPNGALPLGDELESSSWLIERFLIGFQARAA